MLTFDAEGCAQALVERLIQVMDSLMNEFYREATSGLSGKGKEDAILIPAKRTDKTSHTEYLNAGEFISAKCEFYVQAILESFGTGSLADTSSQSYWNEYRQTRDFNKARYGSAIVGRQAGTYEDVWGNERKSSGRNAGKNLEGLHIVDYNTGEYHQVSPIPPSHSIQNAEVWINKNGETKIERRIEMEVKKFLQEDARKFFVETSEV